MSERGVRRLLLGMGVFIGFWIGQFVCFGMSVGGCP